jgi:hypothetical protein
MTLLAGVIVTTLLAQMAPTGASSRMDIPIVALRISDDDGKRQVTINPAQIKRWVDHGNYIYASTGIRFLYKTSDGIVERSSTLLNSPKGTGDRTWLEFRRAGNRLAAEHPGKMTMIFRYGPDQHPSGGGFSWVDYDFVVMPGFDVTTICGRQNINVFPHEVGHYLGLMHTFAKDFDTVAQADAWLDDHKGEVSSFDGDGLSDTPPDPFINAIQCDSASHVMLQGKRVMFDRSNIMGYWSNPHFALSRQQVQIVQWFARRRLQSGMLLSANLAWKSPLEAEGLEITERRGVKANKQPMAQFGPGNWSGDAQLFIGDGRPGDGLTLALPVAKAGRYGLSALLTMAPGFGRIQFWLDGERLGDPVDLYAPRVIPSGRIVLTTKDLPAGLHAIRVEIAGKSPESSGTASGIDCFELVSEEGGPKPPGVR